MKKQLRIILGDIGDSFAVTFANAFREEGEWAITRRQTQPCLLQAIKHDHPDAVILNMAVHTMQYARFSAAAAVLTDVQIIALAVDVPTDEDCAAMRSSGITCLPHPKNPEELLQKIRALCGKLPERELTFSPNPLFNTEAKLSYMLQHAGIPAKLRGFHYLRSAILLAAEQPVCDRAMMRNIYPTVAKQFHSTPSRVERSIRHAILQGWENADEYSDWAENPLLTRRMTNSEFIAFAVEWLHQEQAVYACS